MRVHHLNCATLCPPLGWTMRNPPDHHLVCHCLLVETNEGLLLVDTGLGTADLAAPGSRLGLGFTQTVRPRLDPAEPAVTQIRRLGYDPADVRTVVLTHLDLDHAGGLADFPHARAHVLIAEQEAAVLRSTFIEKQRYRPAHIDSWSRWSLHAPRGEAWFGFPCVRDLPGSNGDILMIPLPGHTRGHTGVAVRDGSVPGGSGWKLHAGDAYLHRDQLTRRRAPLLLRLMERVDEVHRSARLDNLRRLQALVADPAAEVRVFCSHDPVEFAALSPTGR